VTGSGPHGLELTVDPDDLVDEDEGTAGTRAADADAALSDYAELARLLRAADGAGDRAAMAQIREEMDILWPALSDEQRGRIEDGEYDW
jgi:hypothetical protein